MTNIHANQAPAKWQKTLKKFKNSSMKTHQTIHVLTDTVGTSYGVCQKILTENFNMRRIAPSQQRTCPDVPENHRICD
jgi:hypothetical protein